jgi:DNA-binding transcriptional LysR family regulator
MPTDDMPCLKNDMLVSARGKAVERLPLELLTGLPALLVAAKEGSATRAAARLDTTPATVLRHIEAIEACLGVRLFDRLATGLVGTAALNTVLPWAEQCAASIAGMRRDVLGLDPSPSGIVRVAAPPTIASHLLVPQLRRLQARHPAIAIEFASDNAIVDLAQHEADLAVRVVKPTQGDLAVRKLADYRTVVACAPRLVEVARTRFDELPWLTWDRPMAHIPEARWLAATFPRAHIALAASELGTLVRAARAGVGALLVAEPIATCEGGLVRLPLPDLETPGGSLWLVAHRALRQVPRVAAVWEWLESYFASTAAPRELTLRDAWPPGERTVKASRSKQKSGRSLG